MVWVCPRNHYDAAIAMAEEDGYSRVLERGTLSIVKSQSVDGGRIRLCTKLPCAGQVIVKLLAAVFADYFVFDCLAQARQLSLSMKRLLGLQTSLQPTGHVFQNASLAECPSAASLTRHQSDVIKSILASPESVHSLWSIAGGGKSRTIACILDVWRRQTEAADRDQMAWVMVPRQLLRTDLFDEVKDSFPHGEMAMAMVSVKRNRKGNISARSFVDLRMPSGSP